ncbi:MAG: phospholipase D-like domain-containing protein [Chitinophagaceae bacterium]|jgi:phosphatidylserine/phosphatidylglycerophosphate/cardiolipin synthase-like enzyme
MKLTPHTIENLAPYLINRKGKQLVNLFNDHGFLDHYNNDIGALPDIGKRNGQPPSKTQYMESRLNMLSGKQELREVLNVIINEFQDPETIIPKIDQILSKENFQVIENNGTYSIQGGVIIKNTPVVNDAHFLNIQNQILEVLDSAKVSITVAMAWFTNDVLFDKLKEKIAEGIDVKVAVFDDGINKKHGVDIDQLPHFKIRGSRGGLMHNKFCVVDNQTVITGSYNWSTNAETRNDENITIQKDPELATKFSVEFRALTTQKDK